MKNQTLFTLLLIGLTGPAVAERIRVAKPALGAPLRVEVPERPAVEGVDADGWYVHTRVDVVVMDGTGPVELVAGGRRTVHKSLVGEGPHALFAAPMDGSFDLEICVLGGIVAIEGIHVERHHMAPTKKLLGKENGKLGPDRIGCGMLGFSLLTEHECTASAVLAVTPGGPAEAAGLRQGDLITHVEGRALAASSLEPGWRWFEESHEAALGRAIEAKLLGGAPAGQARTLSLNVRRLARERGPNAEGAATVEEIELVLQLPRVADKPADLDGFPLRGEAAARLRADMLGWTLKHRRKNGTWPGVPEVNTPLGALALLSSGDDEHLDAVRATVDHELQRNPRPSEMTGLAYWWIAYTGILFCEYHLRTGDERVLPWVREAATWLPTTTHESKWGMQAFGHGPDGLPYDDKALMAPTAHLLVFDALARSCGVESRIWEHVEPYVRHSWSNPADGGHGAMGYNASYRDKDEFWSRTGLVALAEVLRDRAGFPVPEPLAQFLCVLMQERHPWMLNSHAYGEPGAALGLLSLGVVKPDALEELLPQWRWRFLCAWEPGYGLRYSTPHMGAPYMAQESIVNLAYTVLLSLENSGLACTTKR